MHMRTTALVAILLGVLLPAIALADDSRIGPPPPPNAQGTFNSMMHVQYQGPQGEANIEMQGQGESMMGSSTEVHIQHQGEWQGPASGTPPTAPWMSGDKVGIENRFGTTTPPGIMMQEDASSSGTHFHVWGEASSSAEAGAQQNMGPGEGVSSFFRWLFALPASTTIGALRASLEASTTLVASSTASSTDQTPPPFVFGDLFGNIFAGFRGFFGGR